MMLGVLTALLLEKFGYLARPAARRRKDATQGRIARRVTGIDLEEWDGPPILGEISNAGSAGAADYVLDWPTSRFAHASAHLVRQLESRGGEGSVIALTAPEPCEQKSIVAVAMARAAARMGKKTVIIDCDPAHRAGAALHTQAKAGLYEVLTGAVPLNDALVKDPRSQAFILTLMQRPPHAAAMFNSPQMARLIDILRDACDFVILDCGPTLTSPDTGLIARHADATILISRREKLRGRSLTHATQLLLDAKAAPVGLVLAS
jgi:Mrp family chromosome partitioning ATPase